MQLPSSTLLEALRQLPLLSSEQMREAETLIPPLPNAAAAAADLVKRGMLTTYQGEELTAWRVDGLTVGQYVLLERLGKGGMGEVFRARHQFMGREVALKRIKAEVRDQQGATERFLREVRASSLLSHPNVIQVFDAGDVNGTLYLAMELLRGTDLSRCLQQRGALPVAEALEYVRQACLGMQHAHEKGLVHRDLKPANLMLCDGGQIKILDLGLAQVPNASTLTESGAFFGTLDYMAPEQVTDAKNVDVRADVYSLGCTAYHLLTGKVPFASATPATRPYMHVNEEPPAVESLRAEVPVQVAAIVRKMMAKKREDRYRTPAEAAKAIGSLVRRRGDAKGPAEKKTPARLLENRIGMKFVLVGPGKFLMGSPACEQGRGDDEKQHAVTFDKPFYAATHPVTQRQWKAVMGNNPSWFARAGGGKARVADLGDEELASLPVEQVSWQDVQEFLLALALNEDGRTYRLPTEAEWEYACRAGTTTAFHCGDRLAHEQANFDGHLDRPCKVGSYAPNAWGLYDMHGNLWEWCDDRYKAYPQGKAADSGGAAKGDVRVIRGGCWFNPGATCRAATRGKSALANRDNSTGFRIVAVDEG